MSERLVVAGFASRAFFYPKGVTPGTTTGTGSFR